MDNMVKKFFGGFGFKINIKNQDTHEKELLNDPVAIELFKAFYNEGANSVWRPSESKTCEALIKYLKQ